MPDVKTGTFDPYDAKADLTGLDEAVLVTAADDLDGAIEQARDAKRRIARERQRRSADQQFAARMAGLTPEDVEKLRALKANELDQIVGVGGTAGGGEVRGV